MRKLSQKTFKVMCQEAASFERRLYGHYASRSDVGQLLEVLEVSHLDVALLDPLAAHEVSLTLREDLDPTPKVRTVIVDQFLSHEQITPVPPDSNESLGILADFKRALEASIATIHTIRQETLEILESQGVPRHSYGNSKPAHQVLSKESKDILRVRFLSVIEPILVIYAATRNNIEALQFTIFNNAPVPVPVDDNCQSLVDP